LHCTARIVHDSESQIGLENGTSIIFEATHDGGDDADAILTVTTGFDLADEFLELIDSIVSNRRSANSRSKPAETY
jgi:hypothetical protein